MTTGDKDDKLNLSPVQVIAAVAATLSAAVLCGRLGVTGTLLGAGIMSATATTGSALYSHSMKRAGRAIRRPAPQATPGYSPPRVHKTRARQQWQRRRRLGLLTGAGLTLALSLAILTLVELGVGESVAQLWGHGGDAPSIIGGGNPPPSTPTVTPSSVSPVQPTSSVTYSIGPTPTAMTSVSPSASPSASPSVSPSVRPSAAAISPSPTLSSPLPSGSVEPTVKPSP